MIKLTGMIIKDLSDKVTMDMLQKRNTALEAIGQKAETYAKGYCPVDTGRLEGSISHKVQDGYAIIGTNVKYGKYVEKGTYKMNAQPYLKPAAEEHMPEYEMIMQTYIRT